MVIIYGIGGRAIFDSPRSGGKIFWTRPEGGAKILDASRRGAKNFRIDLFFILKFNVFCCFYGFWGIFNFWVKGGAKIFGRVAKGGRKI